MGRKAAISETRAFGLVSDATVVRKVPALARLHEEIKTAKRDFKAKSTCAAGCDDSLPEFEPFRNRAFEAIISLGGESLASLKRHLLVDSITYRKTVGGKPQKFTI